MSMANPDHAMSGAGGDAGSRDHLSARLIAPLTGKQLFHTVLLAASVCLIVYLRALSCGFVNLDDPHYVYENPAIRILDLKFVHDAFTTSYMGWWMPLTWISLAIDYALWEGNPFGYHLTNILVHAANAGLVVLIADRLLRDRVGQRYYAATLLLAALLWGIHPLRVESVAWVTERKDVLNGFFSLGAILFYLRHAQTQRGRGVWYSSDYGIALVMFLLSLAAKPVSVVLPLLFLLLDWYPLQRFRLGGIRSVIVEKIPFFLLAAASSAATIYFAAGETILIPFSDYPLKSRLLAAGYALVEYLRMIIWPSGLTHFYPIMPELPVSYYVHSLVAVALTLYLFRVRKERPWLLASWAAFILPLLPVLGLLQNGEQSHADRFSYLPAVLPGIAAAVVVVTCMDRVFGKLSRHKAVITVCAVFTIPVLHGLLSVQQIGYWRDSGTLWSRLIEVRPVGRAYFFRGQYFMDEGDYSAAAADFGVAAKMAKSAGNPEAFNLHALRGDALSRMGRFAEAVEEFSAAIALYPHATYYYHRGVALRSLGRVAEAENDFSRAGRDTGPIVWQKLR